MNIFLQTFKIHEAFEVLEPHNSSSYAATSKVIQASLRPCTIQLTNHADICDKLSDIYEMSDAQIQVLINNMITKNVDKSIIKTLEYIYQNKTKLPINACKIQLEQMHEIKQTYPITSVEEYPYKYITKNTEYDDSRLTGYCLLDISNQSKINNNNAIVDNIQDIANTNANQLYELHKFNNSSDIDTIKDLYCTTNTTYVGIDNKLMFMRLHTSVSKDNIIYVYKIDVVSYDTQLKRFQQQTMYDISSLFQFQLIRKQIILGFATIALLIYTFTFDICKRIKTYSISSYVYFSFNEIANIRSKLIDNNVDLQNESGDVKGFINVKINNIIDRHNAMNDQIQAYNTNMTEIMTNYKKIQDICEDTKCKQQMDYLLSKYENIASEKTQLESELTKLKEEHSHYVDISKKLKDTAFTLNEINEMLGVIGMPIPYEKYSKYISNDNCIYLQI